MMSTDPPGVILSRDDAFRVWQALHGIDEYSLNVVRDCLGEYLRADWRAQANAKVKKLEQWNPRTPNPSA